MAETPGQLVNLISFALPAKQFIVECEVTEQRPLPVVEEMVARMLHVAEELPTGYLKAFLGLSDFEVGEVISALEDHRMATINAEGRLNLTSLAREAIRRSPEGQPRLIETLSKNVRLTFDIATFHPILGSASEGAAGLPELKALSVRNRQPSEMAVTALKSHFAELRQRIGPLSGTELYKVIRCDTARSFQVAIDVAFTLSSSQSTKVEREILPASSIELQDTNELEGLISRALQGNTAAAAWKQDLAEFIREFDDSTLSASLQSDRFDVDGHIRAYRGNRLSYGDKETRPVVGPLYVAKNMELMQRLVSSSVEPSSPAMYWIAPDVPYWAASTRVGAFLSEFEGGALGGLRLPIAALLRAASPSDVHRLRVAHGRRMTSAFTYSGALNPASWELFCAPGIAAAALTHVYAADTAVPIPVGFVTTNQNRVSRVAEVIKKSASHWYYLSPLRPAEAYSKDILGYLGIKDEQISGE